MMSIGDDRKTMKENFDVKLSSFQKPPETLAPQEDNKSCTVLG